MPVQFKHTDASAFAPFTRTRPVESIRTGILTIREKWALIGQEGEIDPLELPGIMEGAGPQRLENITDVVRLNAWSIVQDIHLLQKHMDRQPLPVSNRYTHPQDIYIEKGAVVEHCIINASEGPVYIGKDALVMEGSLIRGPVAICNNAVVKMGTKLYAGTTIGPYCTAGGEIKNSILSAYSNKAHDGYLGDSILGEWCNLGAGTSNSNIKNTGGNVRLNLGNREIDAGIKFGLLMGDYSRAAINTSFNTGTVVGVCCNVFTNGLTPKYIPDFSWGCTGATRYELPKAFGDIGNWKAFKGQAITEAEKEILIQLYKA